MELLYAPMRRKYYHDRKKKEKKEEKKECIFCNYTKEKDILVYDGNKAFILANKYPYNLGHLMVVPKRHVVDIKELTKEENTELMNLIQKAVVFLEKAFNPRGFNIGLNFGKLSGASIEHLHFHILPRYKNDMGFLETIYNTRVVQESPKNMVKELKKKNNLL